MNTKYIGILVIALLLAGCGRQRPDVAAAASSGPIASSTAPDAQPGNPAAASSSADPAQAPQPLTIPAHTRIRVRLAQALDTRRVRPGQQFTAYLDNPIVIADHMVVPKGRAYLGLTLDGFQYGGINYSIGAGIDVRASGSHKTHKLALIGGGVGAAIGAGAGAAAGTAAAIVTGKKNVRLPAETVLYFSRRSAVTVGT